MDTVSKHSLYQKLLEAQKAIGYVAKNGKNSFQGYNYTTEADTLVTVKTAANEAGLVLTASTSAVIGQFDNGGKITRYAHVKLTYRVIDAESGEFLVGTFDGYAEDTGDKAIYKATTGAYKYFLFKVFGVATGDDPEKDEPKQAKPAKPTQEDHAIADLRIEINDLKKDFALTPEVMQEVTGLNTTAGATKAQLIAALAKLQTYCDNLANPEA